MLVKGYWYEFHDGAVRPVVDIKVQRADDGWEKVRFLLDSGADRTVLDASLLPLLTPLLLPEQRDAPQLGGVGGSVASRLLETRLAFTRDDDKQVTITGTFAIFTEMESTDYSILGRDITDNFDVIYSFPKREVLLLASPHTYATQLPF